MPKITREEVRVPADVMPEARDEYITNYLKATRETGRLMLFACDQKIEHLNKDFYGEGIDIADLDPEHLFKIGSEGVCGVLAGQRGLVAQYAADYPEINYLIKMNSKTNLVGTKQEDPYSPAAVRFGRRAGHEGGRREHRGPRLHDLPRLRVRGHHDGRGRRAHRPGPCQRPHRRAVDLPPRQGRDC